MLGQLVSRIRSRSGKDRRLNNCPADGSSGFTVDNGCKRDAGMGFLEAPLLPAAAYPRSTQINLDYLPIIPAERDGSLKRATVNDPAIPKGDSRERNR